ncbi:hypothetical protein [Streptomyces sp. NPDC003077]|uniref:hypothetical protein n=1 Tax=Streptomyces sp. NPDC003077 TaxID=3154443 RepID=UPI0033BB4C9D
MIEIPGYASGPLTHEPELLTSPLFWLGHLYPVAGSEETEELLFGADDDAAEEFHRRLTEREDWPVFTVPLAAGHRLHVVYRNLRDDPGVDYLLYHPAWERALLLARNDGHFMGPALSWPELSAASGNGLPGGSTTDPRARLLLLLPAMGDDGLPDDAVPHLADALTSAEEPHDLAVALAEDQGPTGPVFWSADNGFAVNHGTYSYRNPSNAFALTAADQARVSAAFAA